MQRLFLDWRQILIDCELDGGGRLVVATSRELIARSVLQEHVFNVYLVAVYQLYDEPLFYYLGMTAAATASDEFSEFP